MRTTMTLDDDLFAKFKAEAHERGIRFKEVVNEAVRAGLRRPAPPAAPYRVQPWSLGMWPDVNLDKALQLAGRMEDEETVRKMRRGT